MSEARKYHLNLIVANQFTTQLTDEIRDAVFGNMGTIVSFRVGQNDVEVLSKYFQPTFEPDDLLRVPNYNTIARTLIGGVPTQPFSMATLPALGSPNPKLAEALKQLSAAKYGRPKNTVEEEITKRLATKPAPPTQSPLASPPANWPSSNPGSLTSATASNILGSTPAGIAKPNSFLDDWLAKRRTTAPSSPPTGSQSLTTPPPSTLLSRQPSQAANEGELKINNQSKPTTSPEDTIYIDSQGNIHDQSPAPNTTNQPPA